MLNHVRLRGVTRTQLGDYLMSLSDPEGDVDIR
jgi:hypothetical protein